MKIIYTDGIYDLFHRGHIESLLQIKQLYPDSYLIVGVINDIDSEGYKRKPIFSEDDRYCIIENIKCVDKIVKDAPLIITNEFMEEYSIDLVVHSFSNPEDSHKQDAFYEIPRKLGKFQEIPYYSKISTTSIMNKIEGMNK
jgi:choline-phosphate cytidylyltransferase